MKHTKQSSFYLCNIAKTSSSTSQECRTWLPYYSSLSLVCLLVAAVGLSRKTTKEGSFIGLYVRFILYTVGRFICIYMLAFSFMPFSYQKSGLRTTYTASNDDDDDVDDDLCNLTLSLHNVAEAILWILYTEYRVLNSMCCRL